jgi:hypothetical protein
MTQAAFLDKPDTNRHVFFRTFTPIGDLFSIFTIADKPVNLVFNDYSCQQKSFSLKWKEHNNISRSIQVD